MLAPKSDFAMGTWRPCTRTVTVPGRPARPVLPTRLTYSPTSLESKGGRKKEKKMLLASKGGREGGGREEGRGRKKKRRGHQARKMAWHGLAWHGMAWHGMHRLRCSSCEQNSSQNRLRAEYGYGDDAPLTWLLGEVKENNMIHLIK